MKGIILNLVEEAIVADHGEATWDEVLDRAGADGAYTSLGNYSDAELPRLVAAGAETLDVSPDDLTRHLGRRALSGLAQRYPQYFEPHDSTREFLLTLNDVIHPEVRKLHPESVPPDFWFEGSEPEPLVVHYSSRRHLCTLAAGMMEGAGEQFGEHVTVVQETCRSDGADHCTFRCSFEPAGARA